MDSRLRGNDRRGQHGCGTREEHLSTCGGKVPPYRGQAGAGISKDRDWELGWQTGLKRYLSVGRIYLR